jgi:hypothetical protein
MSRTDAARARSDTSAVHAVHTAPDVSHPAPQRHRVGSLRLLAGLFGAPLAWLAQMSLSEPLAAQACYPNTTPLNAPQLPVALPSLQVILALITGAALIIGIVSTMLAWSAMRQTHHQSNASAGDTVEHGGGRAGFLATVAVMAGLLFVVAILITGLAVLLVSPCSLW